MPKVSERCNRPAHELAPDTTIPLVGMCIYGYDFTDGFLIIVTSPGNRNESDDPEFRIRDETMVTLGFSRSHSLFPRLGTGIDSQPI
jgi:hypothetical protein